MRGGELLSHGVQFAVYGFQFFMGEEVPPSPRNLGIRAAWRYPSEDFP
jgi:hypothetical protein